MKIIKDIAGQEYKLYADRVEENDPGPYVLKFSALRKAVRTDERALGSLVIPYRTVPCKWIISIKRRNLGCRNFDDKTFRLILKAAGVKR